MDIRQLRTFLQVTDLGSLSRAADRLGIAQPALGRQVRMLEEELGTPLFTRHGRGMVPTPAGQLLAERATAILRMVEETRAEITAGRDVVRGTVTLGVPPTAGEVISGPLVERFVRLYPEVMVRIVPAFGGYLQDMLQRGELDLAVMYETNSVRRLGPEPLIVEKLCLAGPPDSSLSLDEAISFRQLSGLSLILPGPRHGLRILLEDEAGKAGITLTVPIEADSLQTLKDLASRGLGHTILPFAAVDDAIGSGALCAAPVVQPELSRRLVLARTEVKPVSQAARLFADILKSETANLVRSGKWAGELPMDAKDRVI
jgi:DNA-binding transcriptional LysR family regulator